MRGKRVCGFGRRVRFPPSAVASSSAMNPRSKALARSALATLPAVAAIAWLGSALDGRAQTPRTLKFREQQIASDFGVGYAVATGDVNGDKRTDIVAISGTDLVWFEAPGFEKRVILSGATPKDNV